MRRARAVGDLGREHLRSHGQPQPSGRAVWDDRDRTLTPVPSAAVPPARERATPPGRGDHARLRLSARREVMLHVHITDRELLTSLRGSARGAPVLGRVEHARTGDLPITASTIRAWCGAPNTRVTVMPVLDLAGRLHHDAYEIPGRLREQIISGDHTCVYPGCAVPARACDLDHVVAFDHDRPTRGGPTATENLAPLCRRHHRLKTTGRIGYTTTGSGAFVWDLGTGETFLRDHRGTRRITRSPERRPPDP